MRCLINGMASAQCMSFLILIPGRDLLPQASSVVKLHESGSKWHRQAFQYHVVMASSVSQMVDERPKVGYGQDCRDVFNQNCYSVINE